MGGKVPADTRVVQLLSSTLRIDQSILTGESGSVAKQARPRGLLACSLACFSLCCCSRAAWRAGRRRALCCSRTCC